MQLFPRPFDFVLFPDCSPDNILKVPYVFDLIRLSPYFSNANIASYIHEGYLSCLRRAREVLRIEKGGQVPQNVVLVRDWTSMIPRRRARVNGMSANAAGMMGLIWVGLEEELEEWKRRGTCSVLRELGVPTDNGLDEVIANKSTVVHLSSYMGSMKA